MVTNIRSIHKFVLRYYPWYPRKLVYHEKYKIHSMFFVQTKIMKGNAFSIFLVNNYYWNIDVI